MWLWVCRSHPPRCKSKAGPKVRQLLLPRQKEPRLTGAVRYHQQLWAQPVQGGMGAGRICCFSGSDFSSSLEENEGKRHGKCQK